MSTTGLRWTEPKAARHPLAADDVGRKWTWLDALEKLVGPPEQCSKRWVWEQYDHVILGNTVQMPGGDAGVVRVAGRAEGAGLPVDVTPRYCEADPYEGGKQAVADGWRNITATGAEPLAATDNLNFGNPERPEIMGQLVADLRASAKPAARWISRSCPATSRSTTRPSATAFCRPPPSAASADPRLFEMRVDRVQSRRRSDRAGRRCPGNARAVGLFARCLGRDEGPPPPVDLADKKARRCRPRHDQEDRHRRA